MFQRRDDFRFPDEWKAVVPESGSGGFLFPAGFQWKVVSPSRCRGDGLWMVSYQRKGGSNLAWRVD